MLVKEDGGFLSITESFESIEDSLSHLRIQLSHSKSFDVSLTRVVDVLNTSKLAGKKSEVFFIIDDEDCITTDGK